MPVRRFASSFPLSLLAVALAGGGLPASAAEAAKDTASDAAKDTESVVLEGCPVAKPQRQRYQRPTNLTDLKLDGVADSSNDVDGVKVLSGNVQLKRGDVSIAADEARLLGDNRMFATGNLRVADPALELSGATLEMNEATGQSRMTDVRYRLVELGLRGQAQSIDGDANAVMALTDARFTSCPVDNEVWWMNADRLRLDRKEGWGEAWDLDITLGGVPVAWVPYITFPIDERRRSGLLPPDISNSREDGLDLTLPYYLNLAEHYDATLRPRLLQNRGLAMGAEFRHLGAAGQSLVNADVLPGDRDQRPGEETDRWMLALQHRQQLSRHWSTHVDATGVSDDDYFHDLGASFTIANRQHLPRSASLNFADAHWRVSTEVYQAQVLHTPTEFEPFQKMPEMRFRGEYPQLLGGVDAGLSGSLTRFEHPAKAGAERFDAAPWLRLPMSWIWGYVTPTARYRLTEYHSDTLTQSHGDDRVSRELPVLSLDSGLFFERDVQTANRDWVQTLEPRLYYLHVPYRDQSKLPLYDTTEPTETMATLFRENRFIGADRIGDSRQLSLGLTSRLISADGGEERLRVGIAQAHYFEPRRVGLTTNEAPRTDAWSPLYLDSALRVRENWELRSTFAWEDKTGDTLRSSFGVHYEPDGRRVVNAEHRYRNRRGETVEQTDLSFAWPVGSRWNVVGRWQQDLSNKSALETLFGVEYESCCWALRLVGRRYLNTELDEDGVPIPGGREFDNGVYVQFVFKGLMGVGASNLRTLLAESIQGYQDRLSPR